ncbi:bifunctional folylpolyglutamate synthase/dihydrofolate synthase [Streptococcus caballi]|uniref:bifunctional folylpolyglutamate synthase/dihydrofolate synthase n=1 Tax=Streptococcus caballi TaxID=439220 RepID=UPI000476105A|nr:folylpolyglutamate synthase/dihydrofolate synthase family protein [Streptococcus caballi]
MNYYQTLNWIHSHKAKGRRPDMKRMKALLATLGNPQDDFPAIHLVGTNGKGSTTSYLQHIFTEADYKTGTFTSPYITRFNERIAIDGNPIPDQDLVKTVQVLQDKIAQTNFLDHFDKPTEFELVTAIMFLYFAQIQPVDLAIIEAGIGGQHDSTNVFKALALVCPSISLDHQETLGHQLTDIARQKVGALDAHTPLIFGPMTDQVRQVFLDRTEQLFSPHYELGQDFFLLENGRAFDFNYESFRLADIELAMLGRHQQSNAALAIMTSLLLRSQFPKLTPQNIKVGLEQTVWPGRCELVRPNLLLDGAHNEDSIAKLIEVLKDYFPDKAIHILFASLNRKPLDKILGQLAEFDLSVTSFDFPEARPLSDYPNQYPQVKHWKAWLVESQVEPDQLYVVTGSLYFISEVRNYLQNNNSQIEHSLQIIN